MADGTRSDLYEALQARIQREVLTVHPQLQPLEVDVFFADELLFASATRRNDDGSVRWRSSHAATPDSHALPHLADAGEDLLARIVADARLSAAVDGGEGA
ncbi:MAG TPA: hypothetical protein VK139_07040 [Microbacteriaceae bacterium]|nr:hypothetical protein [Microbacteriaceae bacterium]